MKGIIIAILISSFCIAATAKAETLMSRVTTTMGSTERVTVKNPEPIAGKGGPLQFNKSSCYVRPDDVMELVAPFDDSRILVKLLRATGPDADDCPVGTVFLIERQKFEARITADVSAEKDKIARLLGQR